jgi:threonine/homoserine/homoserine lactone efflux protein
MITLEFLITSLIVVLIPGTGVIYTVSTGIVAVFVVYGLVAHAFRKRVVDSARVQNWLRYGFAAAFAGLGAKLALTDK